MPFAMIVDDLHELRSSACHDVLEVVIAGVPRGSQLVAASRFVQPHMPRLRASGDAIEYGAGHLALGTDGAEQIFAGADVSLSRELAATLTERTEGWAGLYLAAVIARDGGGEALTISGDDRYVADYLYRESLARLPGMISGFCVGPRCWIGSRLRCATPCSASLAPRTGCTAWRRRTCS